MLYMHERRLSFMINSIKEGQIEKEENIMKNVSEYFGSLVFDDRVMKATLSAEVYQSLKKTIDGGERLDISVANAVADAMKDWAVANGATHYTLVSASHRNYRRKA